MMLLIISSTLGKREALPHVADATAATLRAVSESENSFIQYFTCFVPGPRQEWKAKVLVRGGAPLAPGNLTCAASDLSRYRTQTVLHNP